MSQRLSRRTLAASAAFAPFAGMTFFTRTAPVAGQGLTFDYWHRSGGTAGEALVKMAELYSESNEWGHTVTAINQGGIQELNQKIRAAAAGGGMPAATMGDDYDITQYANSGIIVDLDPFIEKPETGLSQEELDAFLPEQINRHKLPIYNNQRMAMPQAFSAFACFWNVEALEKAGFDAPAKTWAEFPDFARKLKETFPDMVPWYLSAPGDRLLSMMKTSGIEWLKDDGTANFDDPGVTDIMTMLKDCTDEGLIQLSQEGDLELFAAQRTPLFLNSSANIPELMIVKDFTYDGGLPPQGEGLSAPSTETYGPVNAIPKNDDALMEAGWQWLKWLTTPEAYALWIPATSYFPAVPSVADDPAVKSFYDEFPVAKRMLDEVAPAASILAPSPALTEVRGQIAANVINEVLLGRLSPEDGALKLQSEAQDAIDRAAGTDA